MLKQTLHQEALCEEGETITWKLLSCWLNADPMFTQEARQNFALVYLHNFHRLTRDLSREIGEITCRHVGWHEKAARVADRQLLCSIYLVCYLLVVVYIFLDLFFFLKVNTVETV